MKKRLFYIALGAAICCLLFTGTAISGVWYNCVIAQVVPISDGEVKVQILPGTNETRFSERSRVFIDTTLPGAKYMLATVLTAISLGTEVTVNTDFVPSWANIVEMNGIGLVAP